MSTSNRRYVKPAAGVKVRDPLTKRHLPEAGATVAWSPYWERRLAEKSIVEAKAPEKKAKPAAEPAADASEEVTEDDAGDGDVD